MTAREGRKFALTVGGAFLVLALIAWWRHHPISRSVLGGLGAALVVAGLVVPTRLGSVQRGWMALAHAISKITTPIVMAIVYYLVFAPTGMIRRMFGKNSLAHEPGASGYWIDRTDAKTRTSMERQF